jgi:hypothetical protein
MLKNNFNKFKYEQHPFHMTQFSPWPFMTSISLFNLVLSVVMYFHFFKNWNFYVIISLIVFLHYLIIKSKMLSTYNNSWNFFCIQKVFLNYLKCNLYCFIHKSRIRYLEIEVQALTWNTYAVLYCALVMIFFIQVWVNQSDG